MFFSSHSHPPLLLLRSSKNILLILIYLFFWFFLFTCDKLEVCRRRVCARLEEPRLSFSPSEKGLPSFHHRYVPHRSEARISHGSTDMILRQRRTIRRTTGEVLGNRMEGYPTPQRARMSAQCSAIDQY
eukprot:gene6327-4554_t